MIISRSIQYTYKTCMRVSNDEDRMSIHELSPINIFTPIYFDEEFRELMTSDFLDLLKEEIGYYVSPMELDFIEIENVTMTSRKDDVTFEGDGFMDRTCFMELILDGLRIAITIVRKVWS